MSLFEWFGEAYNPGSIGGVDFSYNYKEGKKQSNGIVLIKFFFSLVVVGIGYLLIFTKLCPLSMANFFKTNLLVCIYLAIALLIQPKPDYSNIGLLGGIFDHPFRYSDDINRFLLFVVILLYPGKFIVKSIVRGIFLFRGDT